MVRAFGGVLLLLIASMPARPTLAADLYLAGELLTSFATSQVRGETPFFNITGSETDSSPAFGGALGFGFSLNEVRPRYRELPLPDLGIRLELEGVGLRNYEFLAEGGGELFFSEVKSWGLTTNLWIDIPVHKPIEMATGRLPILEPLTLYLGAGMGVANVDVSVTNNVFTGEDSYNNFAWQAGAGLGYAFTRWATFTLGYRYLSLGDADVDLKFGANDVFGTYNQSITAHELVSSIRFDFYTAPMEEMAPKSWLLPKWLQ